MTQPAQNSHPSIIGSPNEIPEQWRFPKPLEQREYLCNGAIRTWNGPQREVFSPLCTDDGTGARPCRIGGYPQMTSVQAAEALDAATTAYDSGRGKWPTMPVAQRIAHVETFVFEMLKKREDVIRLLMWEIGKPLPDAEKEFDRTVDYVRDTIDALKDLDRTSSRFTIEEGIAAQIRRAPLGVVLCMGPFNYPLNETFTTLIPALIMGNTIIFKPPKLGVLLHQPLLEPFRKAFPPGVVNTVYGAGREVIGPMMASGKIDVLAFIGTSKAADALKKQHPKPHRLRCVLGLEAKNAAVVLQDADLNNAIQECTLGALSFNGQRCTALKILFVHQSIIPEFLEKFCKSVQNLQGGLPWQEGVRITPLPEPGKTDYLAGLLEDARSKGAKVVNADLGGGTVDNSFMSPAVVYPVTPEMELYRVEQFGPVIPIVPFTDINEPMQYVIDSNYGQQVSLFGTNPETLATLIDPLVNQVCRVNINSQCQRGPDTFPFTGRKDSAEGTLSVSDALRVFSIRTIVAAKQRPDNTAIIRSILRERSSRFLSTDFIF